MSVHVLLDTTFFATSIPVADQQRLLPLPPGKGLHVGDTVFLRNELGELTWVGDVLAVGEVESSEAWTAKEAPATQRHALLGYLARIHPGTLPRGTSRLTARWVTLNKRTLPGTLPWWDTGVLVYHSTLRLIEGLLTPDEVQQATDRGYLSPHPSGHWVIPHGEARKRIMVHVQGIELTCGLCGGPIAALEESTQDHIIPTSQGGPDALANVQLAHRSCNELKGNALPEQYPPFFPQPGTEAAGWYERTGRRGRNGRGGRVRRGRPPVTAGAFQAEPTDVAAPVAASMEDSAASPPAERTRGPQRQQKSRSSTDGPERDKRESAERDKRERDERDKRERDERDKREKDERAERTERDEREPQSDHNGRPVPISEEHKPDGEPVEAGPAEPSDAVSPEELAWLESVQAETMTKLQEYAREANWAARTATLRTIEQLPRAQASTARNDGTVLAEAQGRKGRFRLLDWDGRHVLVEERGRRQTVHVVHMVHALAPGAYVWYLSRFGRTSPLAVAMALLPLVQKGTPDEDGRLEVSKNGSRFVVIVENDRIVDCAEEVSLAAS